MASSSSSVDEATPPWENLPREITSAILQKLGAVEILMTARKVCPTWWSVSQDPSIWRCIDMSSSSPNIPDYTLEKLCRHAVDLSQGQLIEINVNSFGTNDLLIYISLRSRELKSLQLVDCSRITGEGVIEAIKNFPMLEEMHLDYTHISVEAIESIGRCCPLLKSFHLNSSNRPFFDSDDEALVIAENMPGICHLQLVGNKMTNKGLEAILTACPHLESLDLRRCYYVDFDICFPKLYSERIKGLKLPHDPIDDYRFDYDQYCYDNDDYYSDVEEYFDFDY